MSFMRNSTNLRRNHEKGLKTTNNHSPNKRSFGQARRRVVLQRHFEGTFSRLTGAMRGIRWNTMKHVKSLNVEASNMGSSVGRITFRAASDDTCGLSQPKRARYAC